MAEHLGPDGVAMLAEPPADTPVATPELSPDAVRRRAFILDLLASAPGRRRKRGELNARLKTKAAVAIGLSPAVVPDVLDQLASNSMYAGSSSSR
jgi:hypothetical protein